MVDEGTAGPGTGDAELVARARAGDQQAFSDLFDRYAPRLHAFCTRVLGDPHTAADATQDTFIVAVRRLDQLRDPNALRPWLYAIARNECTRHGRARDRATPVEDVVMTAGDRPLDDEPARAASAAEVAELLWAAADGLDDRDRALLELQLRHGLEGSELALAAGVAPGQISMATGRMRERLERSVGALLVARGGRDGCPGLAVVLEGWDGRYSVLWRKRVARHVERCDRCDDRRRVLVAPLGSLAIAPMAVTFALGDLPVGLRERTLEALRATAAAPTGGERALEPWGPDGFPPVPDGDDLAADDDVGGGRGGPRRRSALVGVAVLLLVGMLVAGWWVARDGGGPVSTAATGSAPTQPQVGEARSSTTSGPTTSVVASTTAAPAETGTSTTVPSSEGAASTSSPPGTIAGPVPTTAPPATTPPTTVPPATTVPDGPPVLGPLARSGTAAMQTSCNPANATRTVSVTVTDDRGVATVVLRWGHDASGPGERAMTRSGSTWRATLGPFDDAGTVSFRAVATDTGRQSAATGAMQVTIDPCPG